MAEQKSGMFSLSYIMLLLFPWRIRCCMSLIEVLHGSFNCLFSFTYSSLMLGAVANV